MGIVRSETLIEAGAFPKSPECERLRSRVLDAIRMVEWPPNSGAFTLFDEPGKKRGAGSGVKPIKTACKQHLRAKGWALESRIDIATVSKPGPLDAAFPVGNRHFCIEWETGNISSSHRALNNIALGIIKGVLVGGLLIVPTREMYRFLTQPSPQPALP